MPRHICFPVCSHLFQQGFVCFLIIGRSSLVKMNILVLQPQGAVDGEFCKLKILHIFYLTFHFQLRIMLGGIFPVGKIVISLHNQFAAKSGNLYTLITKRLAQFLEAFAGIDQLYLARTFFRLIFAHYPNIGSNTRIIKQVVRQLDNRFQPVMFQQIATNFTFTAACITLKKWRTILDDSHTPVFLQFSHTVEHKQHLSVSLCRQSRSKTSCFAHFVFGFHPFFGCFPVDTERRV